jgi:diaminohydroxyphosphoribosylaminopyrimidine deaminase/5-amino-6-(5-phosphoribosylamino)uracil reductase
MLPLWTHCPAQSLTDATSRARSSSPATASASVNPNPVVGAVVATRRAILGEGWHERSAARTPRSTRSAPAATPTSRATLYVSLEPCCHQGRTPPCTEAILAAGIGRVVVASDDPTEKASGRGLGILRDEGVEVVSPTASSAREARLLNQAFRKHARVGRPWVLFKSAMTLDGKVATRDGDSQVDLRRGEPRARPPLARLGRRGGDRDRHRAGRRPAADRARRRRPPPAAQRVVFDSLARLPPARSSSRPPSRSR